MENSVLKIVAESSQKITPRDLEQLVCREFQVHRKDAAEIIRNMVMDGHLEYVQEYGRTFIDVSLNGPVRLSRHVVVKPPGVAFIPRNGDIVIDIQPGAAFGSGKHPTTRLALNGIEQALKDAPSFFGTSATRMLDIGTGSGILALAGLKMGIDYAVGTDIDPIARFEAMKNAELNQMADRLDIPSSTEIPMAFAFHLVTANLRYPTLLRLGPELAQITEPGSKVVFSGIKEDEVDGLVNYYSNLDFMTRQVVRQKGWVGVQMDRC